MEARANAQMNIRLDAEVKRSGDEAIGLAGFSPTQFLRDIWTGLARSNHADELARQLRTLALAGSLANDEHSTKKRQVAASPAPKRSGLARVGANYMVEALSAYGIGVGELPQADEWDAIVDEADLERYGRCEL